MTRDSVDFPAPLAPRSACVAPGRSVRLAPTSARVCAKLFEIARASERSRRVYHRLALDAGRRSRAGLYLCLLAVRWRTRSALMVGRISIDVLAGGDDDRNQDLLLGRFAFQRGRQGFARTFTPMR